jgi:hypothetical protein
MLEDGHKRFKFELCSGFNWVIMLLNYLIGFKFKSGLDWEAFEGFGLFHMVWRLKGESLNKFGGRMDDVETFGVGIKIVLSCLH